MNRILPEQTIADYKRIGLPAMRGDYLTYDADYRVIGCCGLGARVLAYREEELGIALHEDPSFVVTDEHVQDVTDVSYTYLCGYADGFDGKSLDSDSGFIRILDNEEYQQGRRDGQAAWDAVVREGLVG